LEERAQKATNGTQPAAEPDPEGAATDGPGADRNLPVPIAAGEVRAIAREVPPLERFASLPLAAPVVAAAGGFLVGVATFVLVRVLRRGRRAPAVRRSRRRGAHPQIAASRSFLVDVHLLRR
jgi:hypothetical protein